MAQPAPRPDDPHPGRSYLSSSVIEAEQRMQQGAVSMSLDGVVVAGRSRSFMPDAARLTAVLGHDRIASAVREAEWEARICGICARVRRIEARVAPRSIVMVDCRPGQKMLGVPVGVTLDLGATVDVPAGCVAIEAKADALDILFPRAGE